MKNLFEYLNFEIIITEIKKSRKGIYILIFIACIFLCAADIFLRKHGINNDWFTHFYIIMAALNICIWAIKVYNNICDILDEKKEKSITPEQCKRAISFMIDKELDIITDFIRSKQPVLYLDNLQDNFEIFSTYKKLGIIENSEISNGYIRIKFKKDFIEIIKNKLKQIEE